MMLTPLDEARRWANRAKEHRSRAAACKDWLCRRTRLGLATQAEHLSSVALTNAVALDAALRRVHEDAMHTSEGVPSYDAGLSFILRESNRAGPKSRAAIVAGDITSISERSSVKLLAHVFSKSPRRVARDVVQLYRDREDGEAAP